MTRTRGADGLILGTISSICRAGLDPVGRERAADVATASDLAASRLLAAAAPVRVGALLTAAALSVHALVASGRTFTGAPEPVRRRIATRWRASGAPVVSDVLHLATALAVGELMARRRAGA